MAGRRRSVENYVKDHTEELHRLGGAVYRVHTDFFDGEEALFHASVVFGEFSAANLSIFEHVSMVEGAAQPEKYGYQCQYEADFLLR